MTHLQFSMLSGMNNTYASNARCYPVSMSGMLEQRSIAQKKLDFAISDLAVAVVVTCCRVFFFSTICRKQCTEKGGFSPERSLFATFHRTRVYFDPKVVHLIPNPEHLDLHIGCSSRFICQNGKIEILSRKMAA